MKWQEDFPIKLSEKGLLTEDFFPGLAEAQELGSPNVETVTRLFVGALSHLTDNTDVLANTARTLFDSNSSFTPIKDWMQEVLDGHKKSKRNGIIAGFVKSQCMKWSTKDNMKGWREKMQETLLTNLKSRDLFHEETTLSFASFPFLKHKEHEARLEYTIAALIVKVHSQKAFSQRNFDFFGFTQENGEEELKFFADVLDDELVTEIPNANLFPISDLIALSNDIVQQYHDAMVK